MGDYILRVCREKERKEERSCVEDHCSCVALSFCVVSKVINAPCFEFNALFRKLTLLASSFC